MMSSVTISYQCIVGYPCVYIQTDFDSCFTKLLTEKILVDKNHCKLEHIVCTSGALFCQILKESC